MKKRAAVLSTLLALSMGVTGCGNFAAVGTSPTIVETTDAASADAKTEEATM